MKNLHYSWIICIGCTVLTVCTMGLVNNTFSVYLPYIISQNSFTGSQGSSIITVRCLFSFIGMLFVSKYYKIFNIRVGTTITCLCVTCAFLVYSVAQSLPAFYFASAISGIAYGLGSMIPVSILISRWFYKKRTFALGICASGSGIATLIFPTIITGLIGTYGSKTTFFLEALFTLVISLIVFLLLHNDPSNKKLTPFGADEGFASSEIKAAKQVYVLSHAQWFMICLAFLLLGAASVSATNHLAVLFTSQGYDSMLTALAISVFGLLLTTSKIIYGLVTDRIGGCRSNTLYAFFLAIGLLFCALSFFKANFIMFFAVFFLGAGFPPSTVGVSVLAADFADETQFASVLKRFQLSYVLGSILFSSLPGIIADYTGSYVPAYVIYICFILSFIAIVRHTYRVIKTPSHSCR